MAIKLPIPSRLAAQAVLIILIVIPQSLPVNAFYAKSQDPDGDAVFRLIPKALGSPYRMSGVASDSAVTVFFESEPIIFEMNLSNQTKRPIPVAGTKGRWVDLLEWRILQDGVKVDPGKIRIDDLSAEINLSASGRPMNSNPIDITTLGIGEGVKKDIYLVAANGNALPVGKYKIEVLLKPNSLGCGSYRTTAKPRKIRLFCKFAGFIQVIFPEI